LQKKLAELEALVQRAAQRIHQLEDENRRLAQENAFMKEERRKAQEASSRTRALVEGHERIRRRLLRLRDKLLKLET